MPRRRSVPLGRVRDAGLTRLERARRAGRSRPDRCVVAIVGMHRSGTSALAGTLQEAGLYLGDVLRKHADNAKGTRENLRIVELHDAILAHSGGTWREPPAQLVWTDEHRAWRDGIISSFAGARLWGFKDPRTVLVLDFWREALGDSLQLVGCFRHPGAVASSLLRRDGGSAAEWHALWSRYNGELLRAHTETRFPLVEFGSDPDGFREQVVPVLRMLGLRVSRLRFFDPALSGRGSAPDVPPESARLYERLRHAARETDVTARAR